jgi:hypothetical protein
MSKVATLTTIPKEPTPAPKKKERERIVLIETPPKPEWFVQTTLKTGQRVWFLRLQVTGICPCLYGPFKTRHASLLFLDSAIDKLHDWIGEVDNVCGERKLSVKYQKVWPPLIEHPVVMNGGRR